MNPLDRLCALREKEERLIMGLSSGTSADGLDAALVRVRGNGISLELMPVAGRTFPYDPGFRRAVLELGEATTSQVCKLNFVLGEFFGSRAVEFLHEQGLHREDLDLIGSHGQTIYHIPRGARISPSTLQIGEPDVIAEITRVPVIADFRTRDVAAGGGGAPLVPYVDYLLFRRERPSLALQNIGGIANVSVVTENIEDVIAFDTGPGNMPLDHLTRILTRSEEAFDQGGKHAARGRVDENLLAKLMTHPFLQAVPPRSTGREAFGESYVMGILSAKGNLSVLDVLATMTRFVARSIHMAYEEHVFPRADIQEVAVSGGGLDNLTLMSHLRHYFDPVPVVSLSERGHDPHQREATAFAVLANESLFGNPNNVPAATGARWPVVLGKISP